MGWLGDIGNFLTNRPGEKEQRQGLLGMGQTGQANYNRLGTALNDQHGYMQRIARGEESVSAKQLADALQQNLGAQQSMAAGAAPQNAAMAGLHASRNAMNLGAGLAGQQAVAGIQERQAAQDALTRALLAQRGQDQGSAMGGYQNMQPGASWLDRFGGAVMGAGQLAYGALRGPSGGAGGGQTAKAPPTQTPPYAGYNPNYSPWG